MQPNQPPGQAPTPSPGQNPYEFIMSNPQKPSRSILPLQPNSLRNRLILFLGGGLILIIIVVVFMSFLSSGNASTNQQLLTIAQEQTELIRVSGLASSNSTSSNDTLNFALSTSLSMTTAQQQVLGLLKKYHQKAGPKQLNLKQNSKTDASLTSAAANGIYDSVFTQTLAGELKTYQASLKSAFASDKSASDKVILKNLYQGSDILLSEPVDQPD